MFSRFDTLDVEQNHDLKIYETADQSRPWSWSRQLLDVTSNYYVLIGCINRELGHHYFLVRGHVPNETRTKSQLVARPLMSQ